MIAIQLIKVPFDPISLRAVQKLLDCMRHRCCNYRRQWQPQGPLDPTVWWYMNTTDATIGKRAMEFDGHKPTPKRFFGSWNEFESVLSGNVTVPPQGS